MIYAIIILSVLVSILMYCLGYRNGRNDTACRWAAMMPEIKGRVRDQERDIYERMLREVLEAPKKEHGRGGGPAGAVRGVQGDRVRGELRSYRARLGSASRSRMVATERPCVGARHRDSHSLVGANRASAKYDDAARISRHAEAEHCDTR